MLEDVRGAADAERSVPKREVHPAAHDSAHSNPTGSGKLPDIGVQGEVARACLLEGVAEVTGATTDVEQAFTSQVGVPEQHPDRVVGERGVEAFGVRLLMSEVPEEPTRSSQIGAPRALPGPAESAPHAATLRDHITCAVMSQRHLISNRHIVFFSWRDIRNPEGGGAELYLHHVARGLVERGAKVTVFCAAHPMGPRRETIDGVRIVRRGSKRTVYPIGLWLLLIRRFGSVDLVVDVQNGLPFFTPLATRRPVVVLVHHVHREQWQVVFPGLEGRVGWWLESRVAPRLYRQRQYIAVSRATRRELIELGVDPERIAVVHNGTAPAPAASETRSAHPSVCCVGRLVPHKQVEHAIDAVAKLQHELPGVTLTVVGSGWWEDELRAHADRAAPHLPITFTGHVSEAEKHDIYARSWALALPSLKEGWGLVIGEAGLHGTPTVAYYSAGGTQESIEDGRSGLLADDPEEFVDDLRTLLTNREVWTELSEGARRKSRKFDWEHAHGSFAQVLDEALAGRRTSTHDPDELPSGQALPGADDA